MDRPWDVIVVGARCAGAALASFLADAGARVLLLEGAPRGSDMPLSTHFVQPPGVDVLDELGVGARVRKLAPPSRSLMIETDESRVLSDFPDGRAGYCVRRVHLDAALQDAAEARGATLRDRHRVVDLVRDGDRVTGVVVRTPHGTETLRAGLVVGADGQHSTVAKLAGAEKYLEAEGTRGGYWGYYPAPERWDAEWDAYIGHDRETLRYAFRCDGDLVLLVAAPPLPIAESWGAEHRARLHETLLAGRVTRPLVEGREPVGKVRGLLAIRFFYRRPVGPGFALVGDAGHFKDFVTGHGITDALLDAKRLAAAIVDGGEIAFERYWRERDVLTLPLHFDALRQGAVGFNEPFIRYVFERVGKRPELARRGALVADRKLCPFEMMSMRQLLPWMLEALFRARFDVLSGFMQSGRVIGAQQRELASRRRLLEEVERRADAAASLPARREPHRLLAAAQ
jgi:menaquinone-9 beta-reductase